MTYGSESDNGDRSTGGTGRKRRVGLRIGVIALGVLLVLSVARGMFLY